VGEAKKEELEVTLEHGESGNLWEEECSPEQEAASGPLHLGGHSIVGHDIIGQGSHLAACSTCGAYMWGRCQLLAQRCGGREVKGLASQRSRLRLLIWPGQGKDWRLVKARPLTEEERAVVRNAALGVAAPAAAWGPALGQHQLHVTHTCASSRQQLLARYGVLEEAPFLVWAAAYERAQAELRKRQQAGGPAALPDSDDDMPVHVAEESPAAGLTLPQAARPAPLVLDLASEGSYADRVWRQGLPRAPVSFAGATIRMPNGTVQVIGGGGDPSG
jgi:hypothetical protein